MNDKKDNFMVNLKKIAIGMVISVIIFCGLFLFKADDILGELLLYETIPFYNISNEVQQMFKLTTDETQLAEGDRDSSLAVGMSKVDKKNAEYKVITDGIDTDNEYIKMNEKVRIEDSFSDDTYNDIVGFGDVIYQDDSHNEDLETHFPKQNATIKDMDKLRDFAYLQKNFYTVDKTTGMTKDLFDVDKFLSTDLSIEKNTQGPKVLIFHTHASEAFLDSNKNDLHDGIVGVGDRLANVLEEKYGLKVLHVTKRFDEVDGKTSILGAYERMEPEIAKIIADNPSIELAIDLHRDGLDGDTKLLTDINGKPTAKIMFFNGLSKLLDANGELKDIDSLPNKNLPTNLALSFNLQLSANNLYPGFARKIYLKGYRFSLHMLPKSMLVEVGANTNTKEEAFNAAEPLADIIADVVLK